MKKILILKIALISVSISLPIWLSEYFLTQDGSAHIYSANIILELIKDNKLFTNYFAFNSLATPNSTGHYLIALLLFIFSPFFVSKLISTITLLGLPFSMIWFRFITKGENGLLTTFLLGSAISFNWLWLAGFYNFLLGTIILIITLGVFQKWKDNLNLIRFIALSILFALTYFSHLICFLVLLGSIIALLFTQINKNIKTTIYIFSAFIPSIFCFFIYKLNTQNESVPFSPTWRYLEHPLSILSWLKQLSTVDSFFILSRKTLPFFESFSSVYLIFSPIIWLTIFTLVALIATFNKQNLKNYFTSQKISFFFLFIFSILFSLFAPDDFGTSNGTVLRERIFFFSFVFLVPLFEFHEKDLIKYFCQILLAGLIIFQTLATLEYSFRTDEIAYNFSKLENKLTKSETYITITILDKRDKRFAATPIPQMSNLIGLNKNVVIWDNYEMGHYLFPIVANTPERRKIILRFIRNNVFEKNSNKNLILEKAKSLNSILNDDSSGIDNIIIYGYDENIEKHLNFFEKAKKVYSDDNIRLFRLTK